MTNEQKIALLKQIKKDLELDKITPHNYQTISIVNLIFTVVDKMMDSYLKPFTGEN